MAREAALIRHVVRILVLAAALAVAPAHAATVNVSITKDGFSPRDVTVKVGDTVTWTNNDTASHRFAANNGLFTSPTLAPGQTFSFTFSSAGKVNYGDLDTKKLKGSVTVDGGVSVSIASSKKVVVYGATATLLGQVSTRGANEAVAVFAKAHGQSEYVQVGTATTSPDGAWSLGVKPTIRRTYQARWGGVASAEVPIAVKPRVTLRLRAGGIFLTRVAPNRVGRTVQLQRWSPSLKAWITVRRSRLSAGSTARITWRPAKGDYRVRILFPQKQAGPGYLAGMSPARIFVRG